MGPEERGTALGCPGPQARWVSAEVKSKAELCSTDSRTAVPTLSRILFNRPQCWEIRLMLFSRRSRVGLRLSLLQPLLLLGVLLRQLLCLLLVTLLDLLPPGFICILSCKLLVLPVLLLLKFLPVSFLLRV